MWDHSLWIRQFRNGAFHLDRNAQVKHYKPEELEREKYDSYPDMQNSNHYSTYSSRNTSIPQTQSTTFDTITKSAGPPPPYVFSM
jgi:hypothetical protein